LENRRGEDDKVLRRVWKTVEAKVGKIMVVKTKERREKRGRGKETRREGVEERERKKKKRIMEVKKIAEE